MAIEKQLSSELKIVFTDTWIWLITCNDEKLPITPKEARNLKKVLNEFEITDKQYKKADE